MNKIFSKTIIYVVRCNSNNEYQDSKPCNMCSKLLINLNIKKIVYSTASDNFHSCPPCELECNHVSAGNKFITKK